MDEASKHAEAASPAQERARSVETQLRQRNIASRLFDEEALVKVGRFTILERLGMGAMGAVYRAYDPTLDRAIALKVLHPDVMEVAAEAEITMREEAKALARLSHPNVVTVHEVGGETRQIWIAMELVDGGNLGQWLRTLKGDGRFDSVVDSMLQAGEGLHAAHGAGVVHRDFKPANVLVGTDDRVRVADFGLACRADARETAGDDESPSVGVGTPAYMAPEQWGDTVDALADQYAYCVVFWEALFGARPDRTEPEPRAPDDAQARATALVPVLRKGLRENPEDRYPSMRELLDAVREVVFEKPRLRSRQRRTLGIVAGLLGTATLAAWVSSRSTVDPCSGAAQRLEAFWAETTREQRLAELVELGPAYAKRAAPRIRDAAEAFGADWADAYRTTCLAHTRQEHSDYVFERRMTCLDQAGAAYASVADRVSSTDADLSALVRAAAGLPKPQACTSLEALPETARPPADMQAEVDAVDTILARARTYLDAGAAPRALELAGEAVSRAQDLGFGPVTARALHERGRIRTIAGPLPELSTEQAIEDLKASSELALRERKYPLAVEAWSRRAWLEGTHGADPGPLLQQGETMTAMVRGAAPDSAQEALLYNNLGGLHLARSDRQRARDLFRRSVDISEALQFPTRELDNATINLALLTDDNAARDALFRHITDEQTQLLGEEHPQVLQVELLFAGTTASTDAASSTLESLARRYRRFHPELAKTRFEAHQELAWLKLREGTLDAAADHFEAATELGEADPLALDVVRGYAFLSRGEGSAARDRLETVASATTTMPWQRSSVAQAQLGLAALQKSFEGFRPAATAFAQLEHLPTAVLATRLEYACNELGRHTPTGNELAPLKRALERWRSGVGDRAEIEAALRALASEPSGGAP